MTEAPSEFRTAVLVVHGMGNQRPLETMRGLTEAVWIEQGGNQGRYWFRRDRLGSEVDLSVLTTEAAAAGGNRRVDFHELYWAHLMSETRSVAVLLWLFELVRKGPSAKWLALRWAWRLGGLFLALCILSVIQLPLAYLTEIGLQVDDGRIGKGILVIQLAVVGAIGYVARWKGLAYIAIALGGPVALTVFCAGWPDEEHRYLPILIVPSLAIVVAYASMGRNGLLLVMAAVIVSLICSLASLCVSLSPWTISCPRLQWGEFKGAQSLYQAMPWSTRSTEGFWISATLLILYASFNALFLKTVLGDAARYFRDAPANVAARRAIRKLAVETLQALHQSGEYDRIIVVAHSLGTVVAYDMLRAYWGRVHGRIEVTGPLANAAGKMQLIVDDELRAAWKKLLAKGSKTNVEVLPIDERDEAKLRFELDARRGKLDLARRKLQLAMFEPYRSEGQRRREERRAGIRSPGEPEVPPVWLVTDFVTLGSPLTHAPYLMCRGTNVSELADHFGKRKDERELPTAPPRLDLHNHEEGTLTFQRGERPRFHYSALFGVTRWSNLYFSGKWWDPFSVGDPIGGPLKDEFGWAIHDVDVAKVEDARRRRFFEHTSYWSGEATEGHIKALAAATDLPDALAVQLGRTPNPPPAP